jgi:hypothetical protein
VADLEEERSAEPWTLSACQRPVQQSDPVYAAVLVKLHLRRTGVLRERFPGITVARTDAATIRLPG